MRRRNANSKNKRRAKARDRSKGVNIPRSSLPKRSSAARTKSLHVKAAMLRNPKVSFSDAAKAEGVSARAVRHHLPSGFTKVAGRWRALKSDRFRETMYVPDKRGQPAPVPTKSREQRVEVSAYLRDLGRFLRGKKSAVAKWHERQIAGVDLVTDARTLKSIEAQLSDFAIYSTFNSGAE